MYIIFSIPWATIPMCLQLFKPQAQSYFCWCQGKIPSLQGSPYHDALNWDLSLLNNACFSVWCILLCSRESRTLFLAYWHNAWASIHGHKPWIHFRVASHFALFRDDEEGQEENAHTGGQEVSIFCHFLNKTGTFRSVHIILKGLILTRNI